MEGQLSLEVYLDLCEQKDELPDLDEMPPIHADFPYEVQVAFLVHELLPDRWDGSSGAFLGKDYSSLSTILDIYKVDDQKTCLFFIKQIEYRSTSKLNRDAEKRRKRAESKAKSKGPNTGINVQT
jgi:hypothetical protein|tara:strand:+ start:517 stop:891 length:375 start_codon:yes stop_codon:yes gene_type:complete